MIPSPPNSPPSEVVLHGPPARVSGRTRRWLVIGLLVVLALGGAAAGTRLLSGSHGDPVVAGDPKFSGHGDPAVGSGPQPVKVLHPRRDSAVRLTVEQLATVEPYYRADLRARAAGLVRTVYKDIGDRVRRGDLLVEIDAPDLVQEVAQKEAVVRQREQEVRVARAKLKDVEAAREVARAAVREKEALVTQAESNREFQQTRLARLRKLAASDSVVAGVIDEEERAYKAAVASVMAARAAVERALAAVTEADSTVEGALADIDLKVALVEVARRDLDRARAVADYARVVAPFDGVVVRRTVDPGSFVQNATTGQSEALISIARTDLVTVVAKFPDTAAPFITPGTEAEFTIDRLPGVTVKGTVTRFSPSIQNTDRTTRVEVDLFNGGEKELRQIVTQVTGVKLAPLATSDPISQVASWLAGAELLIGLHKGDSDLLPAGAVFSSPGDTPRLLPGMSGTMTLSLQEFHDGCVLPSTAVYSRSGKPYILLVEDGVTKQYPVVVQLNDGRVAKVAFVVRRQGTSGPAQDVLSELTGRELVVSSRQLEIGEGVEVRPAVTEW